MRAARRRFRNPEPNHAHPSRIPPASFAPTRALDLGWNVLAGGGGALDAVTETVAELERCPLFNAGHGSVLTRDGTVVMPFNTEGMFRAWRTPDGSFIGVL